MSTTIITRQAAIKFSVKSIIADLEHDRNGKQITSLLETIYGSCYLFCTWQNEYVFLAEEYIESNVSPQIPKWSAFLQVQTESDLICGYISQALTSFEGGVIKFKGSKHTKPEAALRKLRGTLDDAPTFEDFARFNADGLDFYFDMQEDADDTAKSIIEKLGFDLRQNPYNKKSSSGDVGFVRYNIRVRKVSDIIRVIMINAISSQTKKVSAPRFKGAIQNRITNSFLKTIHAS